MLNVHGLPAFFNWSLYDFSATKFIYEIFQMTHILADTVKNMKWKTIYESA